MPGTEAAGLRPAEERDALIEAAREAGRAVLPLWRANHLEVWTKSDSSPVTEADLRADRVLREALMHGQRSDYGWLSEESAADPSRLEKARTIIVDPIDGTRAFMRGDDAFTICLAVSEGDRIIAAVIYAPAKEELYAAAAGEGATLNGAMIRASTQDRLEGSRIMARPAMFAHPSWPERWPRMEVQYTNSTSYRMAAVAAGQFDATLALAPKADWDTAPGALIAEEAGARVGDHHGARLLFGKALPVQPGLVCASPQLYTELLKRLAHLPGDLRQISG